MGGRSALGQGQLGNLDAIGDLGVDLVEVSDQVVQCYGLALSNDFKSSVAISRPYRSLDLDTGHRVG